MKRERVFSYYFYIICALILILFQCNLNNPEPNSNDIKLYSYENGLEELNADFFVKQKPLLTINAKDILGVKLIQRDEDWFTLEIKLSKQMSFEIERATSSNIGKRLVFIARGKVLFAPLVDKATEQAKIVVELTLMEMEKAKEIAGYFSHSIEFINIQPFRSLDLGPDFEKALDLMEKSELDPAIEIFENLIKQQKEPNKIIFLYDKVALIHKFRKEEAKVAETYRKLINEKVNVNHNNFMAIAQAYYFLFQYEKKQKNTDLSEDYFNQAFKTLDFITENFHSTRAAEEANLTIGIYALSRGNIAEARKRAHIVEQGSIKEQAYILLGLCYEYEKNFEKAKMEYRQVIEQFPETGVSIAAKEYINNLNNNKTNIKEVVEDLYQW